MGDIGCARIETGCGGSNTNTREYNISCLSVCNVVIFQVSVFFFIIKLNLYNLRITSSQGKLHL